IAGVTGKPPIHERPLLTPDQATEIVALFQALANDSRLRVLHALARAEELCVTDLAAAVEMTPQAISNQLRRLVDRRIVATRREGNRIYYRIIDPCVPGLLSLGLCLAEETGRLPDLIHTPPPSRGKSPGVKRQSSRAGRAGRSGRV
ncbi:MAG TPA: metalloregulator ArsR/SmtB family transcription factor, partial [Blastocatellia bacterium]|nr:metalloregulator ArsR/SmtB family transcription factor [Blastocatellia bacterium]